MTIDELEFKLNRPLFVLKMNRNNPAAGSKARANKAREDIHKLVCEYAKHYIPTLDNTP